MWSATWKGLPSFASLSYLARVKGGKQGREKLIVAFLVFWAGDSALLVSKCSISGSSNSGFFISM